MLLEIARFFASFAKYNPERDRYEIHGVVGPDEYHSGYPDSVVPGINNNAYTNLTAVWTLCRALELLQMLPTDRREQICSRIELTNDEISLWDSTSRKMFIPMREDGIIYQFDGYEKLDDFPWKKNGALDIDRVHDLLNSQGGHLNQYKVSKQPDVLMLYYLFSVDELAELFKRLGYQFDAENIAKNVEYYIKQTVSDSTLSRVATVWVLSRMDRFHAWSMLGCMCRPESCTCGRPTQETDGPDSWKIFMESLGSDLLDIQGGTTAEGVHIGAMASTIDIIQRCYTGLVTKGDVLWFNPRLPKAIIRLSFNLLYRHQVLRFEITQCTAKVIAMHSTAEAIKIGFNERVYWIEAGHSKLFDLE